jgi:hypothetical protein
MAAIARRRKNPAVQDSALGLGNSKKALPRRILRLSKGVAALSLASMAAGAALMLCPWKSGPVVGGIFCGLGLAAFLSAGYYWACGNESCS